jgi:tetratricopeptide (TPR) repeat protein
MVESSMSVGAVELALSAVNAAYGSPDVVDELAARARAVAGGDQEVESILHRAFALAAWARGETDEAIAHGRKAIAVAEAAGTPVRAAEARGSLSVHLVIAGDGDAALREIDRALPVLSGSSAARLRMQRALVLDEIGRREESLRDYGLALSMLGDDGDPHVEADLRNNRSIVLTRLRRWQDAESDLRRAEELYLLTGQPGKIASVCHNRAGAAAVRGDVPAALELFDEAARRFRATGRKVGLGPVEKAEVLLSVRLADEAREAAMQAAAEYRRTGNRTDLAQAQLVLAQAALVAGDPDAAHAEARAAQRLYARLRRPGWVALARYLVLRSEWDRGRRTTQVMRFGRATAAALAAAGWSVQAVDARLLVARIAMALGRVTIARRELETTARARSSGPAEVRARAWHAEALMRLTDGDRRGAERALRSGLAVLDRFRAGLGSAELRAHASGEAGELATLGTRLAVEDGSPAAVFDWAERWRASALQRRSALPPDDPELRDELAELRQVVADITTAATEGQPTAALVRRQARLEMSVRARSRHAVGADAGPAEPRLVLSRLRRQLGAATLVEYLALDGRLHAVVVAGRRTTLHDLGPVEDVTSHRDDLLFGLRRLAHSGSAARSLATPAATAVPRGIARVTETVERAARRLDELLLVPLDLSTGDLIVVPTGVLHAVPWAVLPTCAGRPISVTPSARLWSRAQGATGSRGAAMVLAAGPGLPHSVEEVDALALDHPLADRYTGGRATVAAVTAALDGADVAHIAAHGHLRTDNPLFSALQLADGPLTVYDLERLATPPRLMVLSACDTGLADIRPGDEQLGLASALLGMGTTSLVAAVLPVDDAVTSALMTAFHRYLRARLGPAAALARARAELPPAAALQAAGFLCFGAS